MAKDSKWWFVVEFGIGLVLLAINLKAFLFYAFVSITLNIYIRVNYLRKVIRVFQIANECKLIAIAKKLNVTEEETRKIGKEIEGNLTEEQLKSVNKDIRDVVA